MRTDCVSPIRPLCGIYKSAPRWRKSAKGPNDGSKPSCALPHRSRGQVSVGFHGIKSKNQIKTKKILSRTTPSQAKSSQFGTTSVRSHSTTSQQSILPHSACRLGRPMRVKQIAASFTLANSFLQWIGNVGSRHRGPFPLHGHDDAISASRHHVFSRG